MLLALGGSVAGAALVVEIAGRIWYDGDPWWGRRPCAIRRARRHRRALIASHMAAGMTEGDATYCADRQITQESEAMCHAWWEANRSLSDGS